MITHSAIIEDTLKKGGGTYRADLRGKAELPDIGFMVSVHNAATLSVDLFRSNNGTRSLDMVSQQCSSDNHYVGTWIDDDTVYVDVSAYFADRDAAAQACIDNDESTYWDIAAGKAVNPREVLL